MALGLAVLLVVVPAGLFLGSRFFWGARGEAHQAVRDLEQGDLSSLEVLLSTNRGDTEFAYFFTSAVTPRNLGDALATVSGTSTDTPLKAGTDPQAYELTLTDLAGTLALATHGSGDRMLPSPWTTDFILATTTPSDLYGTHHGFFDSEGKNREAQDQANKTNLLLLLSRGYWSTEFLQQVTRAYHNFDIREGAAAWPDADPTENVGYSPAPNGVYLTDGILALLSALTANPAAAEWVFSDYSPEPVTIGDSDYTVGAFTYYLMFEHTFPSSTDHDNLGMTTVLTALSAAVDSATWATGGAQTADTDASVEDSGPVHDAAVLHELAQQATDESGCSWDPHDYWVCMKTAAKEIWNWIQRWGHLTLDILSLTPVLIVSSSAAAVNALWYSAEGDYSMAGLSLAVAVPAVSFVAIAKAVKAGSTAISAARASEKIATAAKESRVGADVAAQRVPLTKGVRTAILESAPKTSDGSHYIDPNTKELISVNGKYDIGHKPGFEWTCTQKKARLEGWTRDQVIAYENNPGHYQIEAPSSNRSHKYEAASCAL